MRGTAMTIIGAIFGGRRVGKSRLYSAARRRARLPHIGEKERRRAARCYMSNTFNCSGNERCAPIMCQVARVRGE